MQDSEKVEYDIAGMAMLELIWGKGFIAPGGEGNVGRIVEGIDLAGKRVLELGSGIGGGAMVLGQKYGAKVIGLEIEGHLVAHATVAAEEAGLSEQVEFRQVSPGEFPVADNSIDYFYTSGVLIHFSDKLMAFSEAYRLLKPGGMILGYDWLQGPSAMGENLQEWKKASGLTVFPEPLESYADKMSKAGFKDISSDDASDWYLQRAREEYAEMTGPLFDRIKELGSAELRDVFIEEWRTMLNALKSNELGSGYFRGRKP
ncbi:MAG: ubiquinone/menaquinone biosynthesis C-methylase UbiE [Parasphingorhabdus sp.]|jgi:ubiquinone/menaquinone biosynthesis C-methylase UbiE